MLLATSACLDFERRVNDCFDGGRCVDVGDGGSTALDGGAGDGGAAADAGLFVPLDGGGFCAASWCWEAPLPHGTRLRGVYSQGTDVIVAGDHGMLAEYRGGRWQSLQHLTPPGTEWGRPWGTAFEDVWLPGEQQVWRRTAQGWGTFSTAVPGGARLTAVTGAPDAGPFFGDSAGRFWRVEGNGLAQLASTPAGVLDVTMAYGRLFAVIEPAYPRSTLYDVGLNVLTPLPDAGSVNTLFGTATSLWLGGEAAWAVSQAGVVTPLDAGIVAGAPNPSRDSAFAATDVSLGTLQGAAFSKQHDDVVGVRALHASSDSLVFAVGEGGLVKQWDGATLTDVTVHPTRGEVRALVPFGDTLAAVTSYGEVLERRADRWFVVARTQLALVDAVVDGDRLLVLSEDQQLISYDTSFVEHPPRRRVGTVMADAHRLWRSPAGTLVTTSVEGAFYRRPGTTAFLPLAGTGGAWGVSGRGEVARLCGVGGARSAVIDVDLTPSTPTVTPVGGLQVRNCHALAPSGGGWVYGGQDMGGAPFVHRVEALTETLTFTNQSTNVDALLVTPGGLAVGLDGFALLPSPFPDTTGVVAETRFGNHLFTLTTWRGRLFAGGSSGAILERPLPR